MTIICIIILVLMYLIPLVKLIQYDMHNDLTLNGFFWGLGSLPFFSLLIYVAIASLSCAGREI